MNYEDSLLDDEHDRGTCHHGAGEACPALGVGESGDEQVLADLDAVLADPNLAVRLEEGARLKSALTRRCRDCNGSGIFPAGMTCHYCHGAGYVESYEAQQRRLMTTTTTHLTALRAIEQHLQLAYQHRHEAAKLEAALVELKGMVNRAIIEQGERQ